MDPTEPKPGEKPATAAGGVPPEAGKEKEEKKICHNCGQEIKPDEPYTKEDNTYRHNYEPKTGPRSEICEFC